MDIETWLAERRLGVTGSDISVLMGVNPFKKTDDLILDKLGIGRKFEGNAATRAGQILEPIVAKCWAERNNKEITQGVFMKHSDHERFIGTPDFIGDNFGLEIKTGVEKGYMKGCPLYYEYQARWYMMLKDMPEWHLTACIVPKNRDEIGLENGEEYLTEWVKNQPHREFLFVRNLELEDQMKAKAQEFLERMDSLRQPRQGLDWLEASGRFSGGSVPRS